MLNIVRLIERAWQPCASDTIIKKTIARFHVFGHNCCAFTLNREMHFPNWQLQGDFVSAILQPSSVKNTQSPQRVQPNTEDTQHNLCSSALQWFISFSSRGPNLLSKPWLCVALFFTGHGWESRQDVVRNCCGIFRRLMEDDFHWIQTFSPGFVRIKHGKIKAHFWSMLEEFEPLHVELSSALLKQFPETLWTRQDENFIRLTCGCQASFLSVCQFPAFSCFYSVAALRSPYPPTPFFLSRYTSLFLCLFGPQVTTLLPSPPSFFPHFTSDFVVFFSVSSFFCLVTLFPSCCSFPCFCLSTSFSS